MPDLFNFVILSGAKDPFVILSEANDLLLLPAPPYAAPNRTDTSFDTPGSCIVTP